MALFYSAMRVNIGRHVALLIPDPTISCNRLPGLGMISELKHLPVTGAMHSRSLQSLAMIGMEMPYSSLGSTK